MAIGSGLAASLGIGQETTYGTPVAPTRWYEFNSEDIALEKMIVQGEGLRSGDRIRRAARRNFTTRQGAGSFDLNVPTKGLGLLLRHLMSTTATPVQQGATTAYLQTYALGTEALSFTGQVGLPDTGGTVRPKTAHGCVVTGWEFSVDTSGILTLKVDVDAEDVEHTTALTAPSYVTASEFHFAHGSVTFDTVAVANVLSASVAAGIAVKTDRFFLGAAGLKARPILNDFSDVTGSLEVEFGDLTTIQNRYTADTAVAVVLLFEAAVISGAFKETLKFTLPSAYFDTGTPQVGGPDVLTQSVDFTSLANSSGAALTIDYISTDVTVT